MTNSSAVGYHGSRTYKVLSPESPELSKVTSIKPGIGQNLALRACPTAKKPTFVVHSASCLPNALPA